LTLYAIRGALYTIYTLYIGLFRVVIYREREREQAAAAAKKYKQYEEEEDQNINNTSTHVILY